MKIVNLLDYKTIEITEDKKPELKQGYAIVKMQKSGICGSDVTAFLKKNPTVIYPIQGLGHEGVGVIEEISNNTYDIKVGDRVTIEPYIPCDECDMCKIGRHNNCENLRVCGVHIGGVMRGYFQHPISLLHKIPDTVNDEFACLIEPLTISIHAVSRGQVVKDENVVIFGAGTIGVLAAFVVQDIGANAILVDIDQNRLDYAKEIGIKNTVNSTKEDLIEALKNNSGQKLPQVLIDCTGSKQVLQNIHEYVSHGARIVWVGWPHGNVEINQTKCMQKELSIFASRNSNHKFPEAIKMISEGRLPASKIITDEVSVNEISNILEELSNNPSDHLKVVVDLKSLNL